jgi:class 3 adenylate cyclase
MEAAMGDLGAVVDAVSSEPVVIGATWDHGPVALRYAAEFPQRVSHLILETTFIRGMDLLSTTSTRFVDAILSEDWDYFLKVIARVEVSLDRPQSDLFEAIAREEMSHGIMRSWFTAIAAYDATEWLDSITAATLIVQRTRTSVDEPAHGPLRELAARISGATLVRGDGAKRRAAIAEFLGVSVRSERPGAFRTVMFTDLVSSTALTERVGDDAAQRTLETHDAVVRRALASHEGIEVKHTGDGIMAAFHSAADAVRAATAILALLRRESVNVRIGLNAGEPIARDGDLYGTMVNLAARVCDAAESGQALATRVVRDLTAGKGVGWKPANTIEPKGFEHPVTVFVLESS